VVADVQEAGRGQRGNTWASPAGGLWFSLVLRPRMPSATVAELMPRAGAVVAEALREELGVPATVKHPNDVLVEGRKLVGILAEAATRAGRETPEHVVLGVGMNITNKIPDELTATATRLADWCPPPPRAQVLALVLAALERDLLG
jgi:BirA family biotin operon repressor/biotin-[acetyl-CoA-carboxylase] ligase